MILDLLPFQAVTLGAMFVMWMMKSWTDLNCLLKFYKVFQPQTFPPTATRRQLMLSRKFLVIILLNNQLSLTLCPSQVITTCHQSTTLIDYVPTPHHTIHLHSTQILNGRLQTERKSFYPPTSPTLFFNFWVAAP